MNDMRFLRQQDVVDVEKLANLSVTLIGLGSIGCGGFITQSAQPIRDIARLRGWNGTYRFRGSSIIAKTAQPIRDIARLRGWNGTYRFRRSGGITKTA